MRDKLFENATCQVCQVRHITSKLCLSGWTFFFSLSFFFFLNHKVGLVLAPPVDTYPNHRNFMYFSEWTYSRFHNYRHCAILLAGKSHASTSGTPASGAGRHQSSPAPVHSTSQIWTVCVSPAGCYSASRLHNTAGSPQQLSKPDGSSSGLQRWLTARCLPAEIKTDFPGSCSPIVSAYLPGRSATVSLYALELVCCCCCVIVS